jgi:uncharacterized protein YqeY
MSLKNRIDVDIKTAMKAKEKERLMTLRSIKSAILLAETEKGASADGLTEEAELKLLTKAAKQRKESAEIYVNENRQELADKELFEFTVIATYLPQQLSEAEVALEIEKIIAQLGATSPQDMGKVMGVATKQLAGRADGKLIATIVKSNLTGN